MDWVDFLIALGVTVAAFAVWLVGTALIIWGERRVISKMQTRIGPNRLGPFGLLQTVADGAKLFFKEDISPANVDRPVYMLAPAASAVVAMMTFAVIPFGGSFDVGDRTVTLQVWDPEIGMLWILAMSSIGVYGITLGGWASGSKYPLLGGIRSASQMISYELAMSLGLAAVFVWTGSLQVSTIVEAQTRELFSAGFFALPAWNIVPQFVAFVLFFTAAVAEAQRPPFDLPEAEGELVAGFVTEYSGAKFAMFFLAEFMQVITMSAVTVTLFFGGPSGPLFGLEGTVWGALLGFLYFALKVTVFVFIFIWFRGTLPRFKYDRLMDIGWKVMLPLGLAWVLATAAIVVAQETFARASIIRYFLIAFGVVVVLALVAPLFTRAAEGEGRGGGGGGFSPRPRVDPDTSGHALQPSVDSAREAAEERTPDRMGV